MVKEGCFLFFVLPLFFITVGAFETGPVIELTLATDENESLFVENIVVMKDIPSETEEYSNCVVETLDSEGNLLYGIGIICSGPSPIHVYPPMEMEYSAPFSKTLYFPYSENVHSVVVRKGGRVLLEEEVGELLCNSDRKCDETETVLSCPEDCVANEKDGYCLVEEDGVCDPDCAVGADRDCGEQPPTPEPTAAATPTTTPPGSEDYSAVVLAATALAVVLAGLLFFFYNRGKKSR